jgi:hypothetical protein
MDIDIKLTDNQKKALAALKDNRYTSVWYGGWAWWWKTFLGVVWVWLMCIKYPWVRFAFVRDTIKNLKNTTVVSLEKFYSIYNIPENLRWKVSEQKSQITFQNWSTILLLEWCYYPSDPLYNRFGSLELTWAFVEESAEVPLDAIKILKTRVWRYKNEEYGITGTVLETFNPNPWHVYERYYQGKGWDKSIFIESLVYSNNFIDQGYIENLENADESIKKRLLYWQWDFEDNTWMLFKKKDIDNLFTNESKWTKYYIVADVARFGKDTTRISLWQWNTWLKVWTYEKNTITEVADSILFIAWQYWVDHRDIIIDSDGVGGGVVDIISYSTWFINNASPIVTWSKQNYANLKSQCAFELKRRIENGELAIKRDHNNKDKDWHDLQQELLNTYIDEKSIDWKTKIESKDKMKERIGRSPDLLDTMIMRMYPYLRWETMEMIEDYLYAIDR